MPSTIYLLCNRLNTHIETINDPDLTGAFQRFSGAAKMPWCYIAQARDIYKLYADVFLIGSKLPGELKDPFIELLTACDGKKIARYHCPPIQLNFNNIINAVRSCDFNPLELTFTTINSSSSHEDLEEAIASIVELGEEGLGHSFSTDVYRKLFKNNILKCVLAKNPNGATAGFLLGSTLLIKEEMVFHVWTCVRKASLPKVNLVRQLEPYIHQLLEKDIAFITLNVEVNNISAIKLYQSCGFEIKDTCYSDITNCVTHYMARPCMQDIAKSPPQMQEVVNAITGTCKKALGKAALPLMIQHTANKLLRSVIY